MGAGPGEIDGITGVAAGGSGKVGNSRQVRFSWRSWWLRGTAVAVGLGQSEKFFVSRRLLTTASRSNRLIVSVEVILA